MGRGPWSIQASTPPSVLPKHRPASPFRTNGGKEAYGYVFPSGNGFKYSGPFDAPGRFGGRIDVPNGFVASYHTHSENGLITQDQDDIDFLNKHQKPLIHTHSSGRR
jgi:hypothetical protein